MTSNVYQLQDMRKDMEFWGDSEGLKNSWRRTSRYNYLQKIVRKNQGVLKFTIAAVSIRYAQGWLKARFSPSLESPWFPAWSTWDRAAGASPSFRAFPWPSPAGRSPAAARSASAAGRCSPHLSEDARPRVCPNTWRLRPVGPFLGCMNRRENRWTSYRLSFLWPFTQEMNAYIA